jgi:hypothetical protein
MGWHILSIVTKLFGALAAITHLWEFIGWRFLKNLRFTRDLPIVSA